MKMNVEKLQKVLAPVGEKLGKQRHLSAISSGIMMVAPITLISAFINLIANPPVTQDLIDSGGFWTLLTPWFNFATKYYDQIMVPYNMTIGLFGLIAVFGISYRLAQSYKMKSPESVSLIAIVMFLMVAAPAYADSTGINVMKFENLGSSGLFGAMIIGLLSTEITRYTIDHKWTIKMPNSVPPLVQDSFTAIIPALINIIVWYTLSLLCQQFAGCYLPELITNILTPLFNFALNPVTVVLIVTFGNLLWLFGIHGTSVVYSILMPVLMQNMAANAEAYLKGGESALVLYPSALLMWMAIGATGCTLGLTILMCRSKAPQLKTLGKLALIPNWCGVNEPVIFGAPIVLNPILGIPFLLVPIITGVLGYGLTAIGILDIGHNVLWSMLPLGMQNFLMTGHWVNFVAEYALTAVSALVYYPFFKVYEKQLLDQAQETQTEEEEFDFSLE
jgi:cellobiose PTS system EIIC component